MKSVDLETQLMQARLQKWGVLVLTRPAGSPRVFTPEFVAHAHATIQSADLVQKLEETRIKYSLTVDERILTSVYLLTTWAKAHGIALPEYQVDLEAMALMIAEFRRLAANTIRLGDRTSRAMKGGTFIE